MSKLSMQQRVSANLHRNIISNVLQRDSHTRMLFHEAESKKPTSESFIPQHILLNQVYAQEASDLNSRLQPEFQRQVTAGWHYLGALVQDVVDDINMHTKRVKFWKIQAMRQSFQMEPSLVTHLLTKPILLSSAFDTLDSYDQGIIMGRLNSDMCFTLLAQFSREFGSKPKETSLFKLLRIVLLESLDRFGENEKQLDEFKLRPRRQPTRTTQVKVQVAPKNVTISHQTTSAVSPQEPAVRVLEDVRVLDSNGAPHTLSVHQERATLTLNQRLPPQHPFTFIVPQTHPTPSQSFRIVQTGEKRKSLHHMLSAPESSWILSRVVPVQPISLAARFAGPAEGIAMKRPKLCEKENVPPKVSTAPKHVTRDPRRPAEGVKMLHHSE